MFLGTAGYVCAHAAKEWGVTPEIAIVLGTGASTILGWLAGLLAIRRQGIYFAMITLALAQMLYFFYIQAPFTHGEDGIQAVPRGRLFGLIDLSTPFTMYYFVLTIFLGGFLLIGRIIHSPFGQVLKSISVVSQAVVIGDGRRFVSALFTLDEEKVVQVAGQLGSPARDAKSASQCAIFHQHVELEVQRVNGQLAKVQQIKKFRLLPVDFTIDGIATVEPRQDVEVQVTRADGSTATIVMRCRIDTYNELEYYRAGGILHYVLRKLAA
jgi:hypothetical protein